MSTFKQKKELKSKIAAAKKAGKSVQTIGKLQYKLNNLASDPKGNAVRTKSTTNKAGQTVRGSAVKTGNGGTVRSKVNPNRTTGKRIISKGIPRPTKTGGHPSAGAGKTVTTTGLNGKRNIVAAGSGKLIKATPTGKLSKATPAGSGKPVARRGRGHPSAEANAFVNNIGKNPSVVATKRVISNTPPKITMQALKKYTNAQLHALSKQGVKQADQLLNIRLSGAPRSSRDTSRTRR